MNQPSRANLLSGRKTASAPTKNSFEGAATKSWRKVTTSRRSAQKLPHRVKPAGKHRETEGLPTRAPIWSAAGFCTSPGCARPRAQRDWTVKRAGPHPATSNFHVAAEPGKGVELTRPRLGCRCWRWGSESYLEAQPPGRTHCAHDSHQICEVFAGGDGTDHLKLAFDPGQAAECAVTQDSHFVESRIGQELRIKPYRDHPAFPPLRLILLQAARP
jgi:hypothetical protein